MLGGERARPGLHQGNKREKYMRHSNTRLAALALVLAALAGCGDDAVVAVVPPVVVPPVAVPGGNAPITITAATTPAEFAALAPVVKVGTVTIASPPVVHFSIADAADNPIIGFGSTSKSATATVASYPNLNFALAKLVPGVSGSPSRWVSYLVTTVPSTTTAAAPTRPSTDNAGTLVDNGNGTYSYTFYRDITAIKSQVDAMTVTGSNNKADLGDLTYEPGLPHRLVVQVAGNAPGTGSNTANAVTVTPGVPMTNPVNYIYDFVPATGAVVTAADPSRQIVSTANCDTCHVKLGGIPGLSESADSAGFHGGSRNDTQFCVVCHTEQRKYGRTEAAFNASNTFTTTTYKLYGHAVGNFPNFIHKIHQSGMLAMKNYDYGGVKPNEVTYPQDIRNCTKCHDGSDTAPVKTAQGNNWMNNPSALACGACHDGINFTTGKGVTLADAANGQTATTVYPGGLAHPPGPLADDTTCALCHKPAAIDVSHLPVTPPNPQNALLPTGTNTNTNAGWIASNQNRLPAGAIKVAYEIKSVSRNGAKNPVMVFRLLQNGNPVNLNTFATAVANPATGQKEIWDNFMGAPSVYFVFAVPQDAIAAPADFNASVSVYLRSLWNGSASGGSAGTLSGPDAEGYYTATITGSTIPDNAGMLTGGLGYSYNNKTTLPLTQTNLPDYPTAPSTASGLTAGMPNATGGLIVIAPNKQVVASGYTARRAIVADAKCNACHQELGVFTEDSFHAGQRNDGTTCSWCHTPNRTSSGWSADSTTFVHSIHAAAKRGPTNQYNWHSVSATQGFWEVTYPAILNQCEVCHLPGTYDFSAPGSAAAAPNRQYRYVASGTLSAADISLSKNVPAASVGVPLGSVFSFSAATGVTVPPAATTLVTSPTTTVCSSCHVTPLALSHMNAMNGSFYDARGSLATPASPKLETCELCHSPGGVADIKTVHATK
jgi:OmcA/MtrC family decaheme c-type cytochrome